MQNRKVRHTDPATHTVEVITDYLHAEQRVASQRMCQLRSIVYNIILAYQMDNSK